MRTVSRFLAAASPLLFAVFAFAQSEYVVCRFAADKLSAVKEQLTPDLTPNDPAGLERLKVMLAELDGLTHTCKSATQLPEFWAYYLVVAERLGPRGDRAWQKDIQYAKDQLAKYRLDTMIDPARVNPFEAPPPREEPKPIRKKWALVVGIDHFRDPGIPQLRFAVKDSTDFAAFLTDGHNGRFDPGRIRHLTNDQATLRGIREALGWLRSNVQPDDLVVVYFASHGSPREADPNGVSYVFVHDTEIGSSEKLYASSLQMIDLVQELNREIKARRVVLVLDTCYSGDAQTASGLRGVVPVWMVEAPSRTAPASEAFSSALRSLKVGYGRAVITASRADEQSWESAELGNGYFTRFLIGALGESSGTMPLSGVFPAVKERVSASVARDHPGMRQTPTAEFSDGAGSIVLAAPETK